MITYFKKRDFVKGFLFLDLFVLLLLIFYILNNFSSYFVFYKIL